MSKQKQFLLSDESLNTHGAIVRTSGINIDRFLANPVMFYNHDRSKGIIGKWIDIHISGSELYGTPEFDESTELGRQIKRQVDQGFIKGASIGIQDTEHVMNADGNMEIIRCELMEVSVCDIPANRNTLQLYYNDKPVTLSAFVSRNTSEGITGSHYKELLRILGLDNKSDAQAVITAVKALKSSNGGNVLQTLENAYNAGIIDNVGRNELMVLCKDRPELLPEILEARKRQHNERCSAEFDNMMKDVRETKFSRMSNKFIYNELKGLALKDMATFRTMVERLNERVSVQQWLESGRKTNATDAEDRSGWTLSDYRKNAPQELRANPELYRMLLDDKKNKNNRY